MQEWKNRHDPAGVENAGVETSRKTVASVFIIWGTERRVVNETYDAESVSMTENLIF